MVEDGRPLVDVVPFPGVQRNACVQAELLAIVSAVVSITHAYGGQVLAECVETAEQAAAAKGLGVDLAQGWYFGAPTRP